MQKSKGSHSLSAQNEGVNDGMEGRVVDEWMTLVNGNLRNVGFHHQGLGMVENRGPKTKL